MKEITEERYNSLKKEVNIAKNEAARAQGALDAQMEQLKKDFDCDTLKDARALHDKLKKKAAKSAAELETALEDYEKKWGHQ
jgi:hypothetical protein